MRKATLLPTKGIYLIIYYIFYLTGEGNIIWSHKDYMMNEFIDHMTDADISGLVYTIYNIYSNMRSYFKDGSISISKKTSKLKRVEIHPTNG